MDDLQKGLLERRRLRRAYLHTAGNEFEEGGLSMEDGERDEE
jgi:hypothetical protein